MESNPRTLVPADRDALLQAKILLERPSFAARLTSLVGTPFEAGLKRLPATWTEKVNQATTKALSRALRIATTTLEDDPGKRASESGHRLAAVISGAAGGAGGLAALAVELPISTGIMLRSIADIARSEGETLAQSEPQVACLQVFAFGGRSKSDDAGETGYWAVRVALANAVSRATQYLASRGVAEESAPALVRLIAAIAARFNVTVSQKVAAQAIPLVGALAGAAINSVFIGHYQDVARGHFTVRRLEREYGTDLVRTQYELLELD